jgi:hypothetical protein
MIGIILQQIFMQIEHVFSLYTFVNYKTISFSMFLQCWSLEKKFSFELHFVRFSYKSSSVGQTGGCRSRPVVA